VERLLGSVIEMTVVVTSMALGIKAALQHVHGRVEAGTMTTMAVTLERLAEMLLRGSSSSLRRLLQEDNQDTATEAIQEQATIKGMEHLPRPLLQDSARLYPSMVEPHPLHQVMHHLLRRLREMLHRRLHLTTLHHRHHHDRCPFTRRDKNEYGKLRRLRIRRVLVSAWK
jgi:hypothetical protein